MRPRRHGEVGRRRDGGADWGWRRFVECRGAHDDISVVLSCYTVLYHFRNDERNLPINGDIRISASDLGCRIENETAEDG
jgi:hypothetical protein